MIYPCVFYFKCSCFSIIRSECFMAFCYNFHQQYAGTPKKGTNFWHLTTARLQTAAERDWCFKAYHPIMAFFTHPLRLLRMEAMPITILATERALAAFLRANSLICSPVTWSLRNSLLVHWRRPEIERQSQLPFVSSNILCPGSKLKLNAKIL